MLLRLAIERTGLQEVSEEEIDFIRRYLEIERVRFGDKLKTELAFEPEACLSALVPISCCSRWWKMRSSMASRSAPSTAPHASGRPSHGDRLSVEIANDGPDPGARSRRGRAVKKYRHRSRTNTRARLEKAFHSRLSS